MRFNVDTFGHISFRHPDDPGRYLLSCSRAPECIDVDDIMEFTMRLVSGRVEKHATYRLPPVVLTSEKGLVGEHLADHGFGLLLMLTRQLHTARDLGADSWLHRPALRADHLSSFRSRQ